MRRALTPILRKVTFSWHVLTMFVSCPCMTSKFKAVAFTFLNSVFRIFFRFNAEIKKQRREGSGKGERKRNEEK